MRCLCLPILLACCLGLPAPALAQSGGTAPAPPDRSADPPRHDTGGTRFGERLPRGEREPKARPRPRGERPPGGRERRAPRRPAARRRRSGAPVLVSFAIRPADLFLFGRDARVDFRIDDRSPTVEVALDLLPLGGGKPVRSIDLGQRPTGTPQSFRITGREQGILPQGRFELRLRARDADGNHVKRGPRASDTGTIAFHWHRFPLLGAFTYGGDDARFGAPRSGHTHQGQDLSAAEGTPVVAPRGGTIKSVDYQAEGAGHYVILTGAHEDRDYAFFHLQAGSIRVKQGERVRTGQLLGAVGNSGRSSGAHLHFEVWEGGGWYSGGRPVDPLPYLRNWDSWS